MDGQGSEVERTATSGPTRGFVVRVLGPLRAQVDGIDLHVAKGAERLILAVLAAEAGEVVSADTLLNVTHPAADAKGARRSLATSIWRLRRQLGDHAAAVRTEGGGYRLDLARCAVDAVDFEALVASGRDRLTAGDHTKGVSDLGDALGLWGGPALADLRHHPVAEPTVARLEELRLGATEDLAAALTGAGRAAEALRVLEPFVAEHPVREHAWAILVTALTDLGRTREAGWASDRARLQLAEVGLEPGIELRSAISRLSPGPADPPAAVPARLAQGQADRGRSRGAPAWLRLAAARSPFVGRVAELAALEDAIARSATGLQVALVAGEPGAGKTRLVAEAATRVGRAGVWVTGGRCDPDAGTPFPAAADAVLDVLGELDARLAADLAAGPLGALVHAAVAGVGLDPSDAGGDQYELFRAVADLFRLAAGDGRSLVLVVDDLHAAPLGLLLLVRHMTRIAADVALCLILTYRDTELNEPTVGVLEDLQRAPGTATIRLEGLTAEDIADHPDLIALGADPSERRAVAERLHATTGGNPLFVAEMLAEPSAPRTSGPLPLRAAIEAHLSTLREVDLKVLRVAATMGVQFEIPLLVASAANVGVRAADVHESLVRAERARVIDVRADRLHCAIRHELVARGLLANLTGVEQARLHLAIANAIEESDQANPVTAVYDLAHHLAGAGAIGDPARARRAIRVAAEAATRRLDFGLAARFWERLAETAEMPNEAVSARLASSRALRCGGDVRGARQAVEQAIARAAQGGAAADLGQVAAVAAELDLEVEGRVTSTLYQSLVAAADHVADDDAVLRAYLRWLSAVVDNAEPTPSHLRAPGDDPAEDLAVLDVLERASWQAWPAARGSLVDEIGRLARRSGDERWQAIAGLAAWVAAVERCDESLDDVPAGLAAAVAPSDDPYLAWMWETWAAARHLASARFLEARETIEAAYRRARQGYLVPSRLAQASAAVRGQLTYLRWFTTELGGLDDSVAVDRLWGTNPLGWDRVVAVSLLRAGRVEEARPLLARSFEPALEKDRVMVAPLYQLSLLAILCEGLGDVDRAARLRPALLPWTGYICIWRQTQVGAPVDHFVGMLDGLLGDVDGAIERFRISGDLCERIGATAPGLTSGVQLVRYLRLRGRAADRSEADRVMNRVQEEATKVGANRIATLVTMV